MIVTRDTEIEEKILRTAGEHAAAVGAELIVRTPRKRHRTLVTVLVADIVHRSQFRMLMDYSRSQACIRDRLHILNHSLYRVVI